MTRTDLIVLIAVLIFLVVVLVPLFIPMDPIMASRAPRIQCVSNLKQVNLAFRIWEGDHNNQYPMAISVTNGGAMESVATGDVVTCFFVMSNELSTPKILICPSDTNHTSATNWLLDFNRSHISYFVGVDAEETHPDRIMSGDDNLALGGVPVKSGLLTFATNAPIAWGPGRHMDSQRRFVGNISYADGSVSEISANGLPPLLITTGLATNRFAIP